MEETKSRPLTLEGFIDQNGFKPRQWISVGLVFLILLADGMDVTIVSHVFPSLKKDWNAGLGNITFIVTAGFVGMGVGAVLAGRLADHLGRKYVTVGSVVLFGVTALAMAGSQNIETFTVWRILSSIGLGGAMPVVLTLLADLLPTANRAQTMAIVYAGVGFGTITGASLAGLIIPAAGWHVLMLVCGAIPLLLVVPFVSLVPESPAWLASRGMPAKAERSLARLHPDLDLSQVKFGVPGRLAGQSGGFALLVSSRYVVTTVLIWAFAFCGVGLQLTIGQYLPLLLQATPQPGLTTGQSSLVVGLYGAAATVGSIALGILFKKYSVHRVIATYLAISILCLVVIGFYQQVDLMFLIVIMTMTGMVLPAVIGGTQNILAALAYPARVRATGVGAASASGRIGSIAGGLIGGSLIGAGLGLSGFLLAMTVPVTVMMALVTGLKMNMRKRGDSSSEDLQESHGALVEPVPHEDSRRA